MHHLPWGNNLAAEANPTPLENPNTLWEVPYNRLSAKIRLWTCPCNGTMKSPLCSLAQGSLPTPGSLLPTLLRLLYTRSLPVPEPQLCAGLCYPVNFGLKSQQSGSFLPFQVDEMLQH